MDSEIMAHIGNVQAFPTGGHLLDRLRTLMHNGISVGTRDLLVRLLECHDLVCTYNVVTRGEASALDTGFCAWCMIRKPDSAQVAVRIPLHIGETNQSLGLKWHMSDSLIRVSVFFIVGLSFSTTNLRYVLF